MEAPKTKPPSGGDFSNARTTRQVVLRENLPDWAKKEDEEHFIVCDGTNDEKFLSIFRGNLKDYHWVAHDLPVFAGHKKRRLGRKQKERYETFCFGYLFFYDSQVNSTRQHSIYLDWAVEGKVNIYIAPAPRRLGSPTEIIYYKPPALADTDPPTPPPPPPPAMGRDEAVQ